MTEYIHSGIAGKINRITKPHIGNILVTSEFGNAKESTLTEDVLKTAVNDINRIKYAVTYKGEKATVAALPTTGNTQGDMWNVTENGHNYAWTGTEWDDLGGTAVSENERSSDWIWNPVPVYEETLSTAYTYAYDEMANSYPLPNTIFGDGLEALRINIQTPYGTTFAGGPFYFLKVTSLNQNPNLVMYPRINFTSTDLIRSIDFEYQIIKGIGTITSKANKDVGSFTNPVIINISEFWPPHVMNNEPGIAPKILGFAFSGTDLPVGSTIKVYTLSNLITN